MMFEEGARAHPPRTNHPSSIHAPYRHINRRTLAAALIVWSAGVAARWPARSVNGVLPMRCRADYHGASRVAWRRHGRPLDRSWSDYTPAQPRRAERTGLI